MSVNNCEAVGGSKGRPHLALWVLLLLAIPLTASAEAFVFNIVVGDPVDATKGTSVLRHTKFAEQARERIAKRLKAGEVKSYEVILTPERTVKAKITLSRSAAWYRSLILSPGNFEVRPRQRGQINWVPLAKEIPEGIQIKSDPADHLKTYLWSPSYSKLSKATSRFHLDPYSVVMGPDDIDGGWRTYTVGRPVITHREIQSAKREMSGTGITFVSIALKSTTLDRLAQVESSKVEQWVVVLDGEVLGYVQSAGLAKGKIQLTAPSRATTGEEQKSWASQVVGRLAAPLPIPVALLKE